MTNLLLREHPAIRTLPRWFAVTLVTVGLLINLVTFVRAKGQQPVDVNVYMSIAWLTLVLYLVFGDIRTRCSSFDMSLPISARRLWASHLAAVTLSGLLILGAAIAIPGGILWVLWKGTGNWLGPTEGSAVPGIQLVAGWILAVALLQRPGDLAQSEPRSRAYVLRAIVVSAAVYGMILFLGALSPLTAVLPLGIAALVATAHYRRLGACFSLTQPNVSSEGAVASRAGRFDMDAWTAVPSSGDGGWLRFNVFLFRVIYRSFLVGTKKKISPWVTFPFVALSGSMLSGLFGRWTQDDLQLAIVPMVAYTLLAFSAPLTNKLSIIDAVPISRRLVFAALSFPLLLLVVAGYGGGRIVAEIIDRRDAAAVGPIEYFWDDDDGHYYTRVPIRFCRISWNGEVPPNEAPWGESHRAWHTPLYRGASIQLYSPFSTPPGSSMEFVAWQISRATEAVYGGTIPAEEIAGRYLRRDAEGIIGPVEEGLLIHRDYPHLAIRGDGPLFPILVAAAVGLWLLLLAVFLRTFRAGVTRRRRMVVFWALMAFAMLLWMGQFALAMAGVAEPWVVAGFVKQLVRSLGETALGTIGIYAVGALVVVGAYGAAAFMFRRAEFPVENAINECA